MSGIKKLDVVKRILGERLGEQPAKPEGSAFAPANIALCKYWGKRDEELNLPITPSLSVSLGHLGTTTRARTCEGPSDQITLNGERVDPRAKFAKSLSAYLDLFRPTPDFCLRVETKNTIPTAAGMASSASGFAALALALNDLFGWRLSIKELSILARLGSGSACRSVLTGFVEWVAGATADGMDSHAKQVAGTWRSLRLGVLKLSEAEKEVSSRDAMRCTRMTSALYESWPAKVEHDLALIKDAIAGQDFDLLGRTAESNALAMHATGLAAWPPVLFWLPESVATMRTIWRLRADGLPLYFTMDAGPNVKLLFDEKHTAGTQRAFPNIEIVKPFQ